MEIREFDRPYNEGSGLFESRPIVPEAFNAFEPTVSRKILAWISEKSLPVPDGMHVIAVIETKLPREEGPWHYGESVYIGVDGTKFVLSNNHFNIWLCRDKYLVLKLSPVFHSKIARLPAKGDKSFEACSKELDVDIKQRVMQKLYHESNEITRESLELQAQQYQLEKRKEILDQMLSSGITLWP